MSVGAGDDSGVGDESGAGDESGELMRMGR